MEDQVREGKITVAPEVLLDIVQQAALYTDGVLSMAPTHPQVDRLFRRIVVSEGIKMEIRDSSVKIDLFLVTQATDLLALSHKVQNEVIRAMDKMVGVKVDAVNIHIEDIAYPGNGSS
jgi:uncharacterized alkaline shock family protein YloU